MSSQQRHKQACGEQQIPLRAGMETELELGWGSEGEIRRWRDIEGERERESFQRKRRKVRTTARCSARWPWGEQLLCLSPLITAHRCQLHLSCLRTHGAYSCHFVPKPIHRSTCHRDQERRGCHITSSVCLRNWV